MKEKHCSYCGLAFRDDSLHWPKACACGRLSYRNPIPVVNALLPIKNDDSRIGVLCLKRGIEPCRGMWALPGGYLELGETWQEGLERELFEETGIRLASTAKAFEILYVDSNPRRDRLLIFGLCEPMPIHVLDSLTPNEEALAFRVLYDPEDLAFPPHTTVLNIFFSRMIGSMI